MGPLLVHKSDSHLRFVQKIPPSSPTVPIHFDLLTQSVLLYGSAVLIPAVLDAVYELETKGLEIELLSDLERALVIVSSSSVESKRVLLLERKGSQVMIKRALEIPRNSTAFFRGDWIGWISGKDLSLSSPDRTFHLSLSPYLPSLSDIRAAILSPSFLHLYVFHSHSSLSCLSLDEYIPGDVERPTGPVSLEATLFPGKRTGTTGAHWYEKGWRGRAGGASGELNGFTVLAAKSTAASIPPPTAVLPADAGTFNRLHVSASSVVVQTGQSVYGNICSGSFSLTCSTYWETDQSVAYTPLRGALLCLYPIRVSRPSRRRFRLVRCGVTNSGSTFCVRGALRPSSWAREKTLCCTMPSYLREGIAQRNCVRRVSPPMASCTRFLIGNR
jgi:hypothetical protein